MDRENTYKNIIRGGSWAFALRWSLKLIGLVSTVILARLLSPTDFGIVAIAGVTSAFIQQFLNLGITNLLIREEHVDGNLINTGWTLQFAQGILLAGLLFGLSTPASIYFDEPLAKTVIHMYCISALIGGTANIGLVLFRRDLQFSSDFRFEVYIRIIRFFFVILLAVLIRNYWALVIGQLLTSLARVILSYLMHEYRPRFCLKYARKYLKFATAIIPLSIATTLNKKLDVMIVGGLHSTSTLGLYSVAADLGVLFTQELVLPLGRGLLPNLAKVKAQPELLKEVYSNTIAVTALLLLPAGFGLSSVAENLIPVLLGPQWSDAIPLLVWLSLYGAMVGILHTLGGQVQIVTGHEHIAATLSWLRVFLLVVFVIIFSGYWGPKGAAAGALFSTIVALPIVAGQLNKSIGISVAALSLILWRPLVASVLMFFCLQYLDFQSVIQNNYALLALKSLTGLVIYSIFIVALWYFSGRPDGIERIFYGKIRSGLS